MRTTVRRLVAITFTCLLAGSPVVFPEPPATTDSDLARGIREVSDGDFEAGLLTLDAVARELAARPGPAPDLARAYLHLGVAYVGLRQESLADAKFRQALRQDPALQLSADEFPPKVIRLFDAARRTLSEENALAREARKKGGTGGLVLLGAGGGAAAAIAVAAAGREGPANRPPSGVITMTPTGQAIPHATQVTFTGAGFDPDGDGLSFNWTFGDGESGSGVTVTHIYGREGTFKVALTVSDGSTSTTVDSTVVARSLTGRWVLDSRGLLGTTALRLVQTGVALHGFEDRNGIGQEICTDWSCPVSSPRRVRIILTLRVSAGQRCLQEIEGEADANLNIIRGTESCSACGCPAGQAPVTLRRQ
jgi:hypothetical protein